MALVTSGSAEKMPEASPPVEVSLSPRTSDIASESLPISANVDASELVSSHKDVDTQAATRSEEYRQLFRLPPEEVIIQDFNCALQENFIIQGHMYVFARYICFYSNIFGFETKKIIPFHEVTYVRRAKTAGIFPNAIEILAGDKKFFFASFLSRDEAFKLISDGLSQFKNCSAGVIKQQDSISVSSCQDDDVAIDTANGVMSSVNELESSDGKKEKSTSPHNNIIVSTTVQELQNDVEEGVELMQNATLPPTDMSLLWKGGESDAPKIPECYTRVAEKKFPITVEEFFLYFFSDNAINFIKSFHGRCGDRDLKCTSWYPHEKFWHARDVSFQHPIKIYLGAKFGSCQEAQKLRVYRDSHLVIETSQVINDVPYGDYFRVEGLWDVERDTEGTKECCILRVYVNVAFSKNIYWKARIVRSTLAECGEAYAIWTELADEMLKQKNLAKQVGDPATSTVLTREVHLDSPEENKFPSERSHGASDLTSIPQTSNAKDVGPRAGSLLGGHLVHSSTIFKESVLKFCGSVRNRGYPPVFSMIIIFGIILLLMQFSIVVLISRPERVQLLPQADHAYGIGSGTHEDPTDALAWLDKRICHLKEEMLMVGSRLERMRQEHALLKAQLNDLEHLRKRVRQ